MNVDLLERQFIEVQIHAEALKHTVKQFEAFKVSLQSEEINRIVEQMHLLHENLAGEVIIPLYDSLSETERQLSEIIRLLDGLDLEEYLEE